MRIIGWIFTILIIVLGVSFSALNSDPVTVKYILGEGELPLAFVLLIAFAAGILLSMLILGPKILSLAAKNKWLTKKLKRVEDDFGQSKAD